MRKSKLLVPFAALIPFAALAGASGSFANGERGHVLVPVSVNGAEPKPFAVDTGASQTVLDMTAFGHLAGGAAGPGPDATGARGAHGAHGSFAARGIAVESLSLWQAEQRGQVAALMALSELTRGQAPDFAGILGLPFLGRYLVDLDYPARRLALHEGADRVAACDICSVDSAIPVTALNGGLPSVPVTVNGMAMRALLDTGASRTILNDRAAEALGLGAAGTGEAIGRAHIGFGPGPAQPHDVSHFDLPVFRTLGLDDGPALILGIDYLSAGRMALDLESGQAWFRLAAD